jgi:hypothetical protein
LLVLLAMMVLLVMPVVHPGGPMGSVSRVATHGSHFSAVGSPGTERVLTFQVSGVLCGNGHCALSVIEALKATPGVVGASLAWVAPDGTRAAIRAVYLPARVSVATLLGISARGGFPPEHVQVTPAGVGGQGQR